MARAIDVANYITSLIEVDQLKLQKLLFYTQAVCLVKYGDPAFSDRIEAWDYGPVIPDVYHEFKHFGFDIIPNLFDEESEPLPSTVLKSVDLVLGYYGKRSGTSLIHETHSESPWIDAYDRGRNYEITIDSMQEYYKEIFSFDGDED